MSKQISFLTPFKALLVIFLSLTYSITNASKKRLVRPSIKFCNMLPQTVQMLAQLFAVLLDAIDAV